MIKKLIILLVLALVVASYFYFGLNETLTFAYLKENQVYLQQMVRDHKPWSILIYIGIYVLATGLSLPGATILTLAGGALFGSIIGTFYVSIASTLGATLAMIMARLFLQEWVNKKFGKKIEAINRGVENEGAFYLLTLRLVPVVPFFLINLGMGLTKMRVFTYMWVSQLGMLPGTFVYVNAGSQLSSLKSASGILSPEVLGSFVLLGIFPLIAKKFLGYLKAKKVYKGFKKPKKFEYDMIAIGGGAAGLVTAYISAAVKAKVALIEKDKMGGDCLNTGCVPSKAILKAAKHVYHAKHLDQFGVKVTGIDIDFSKVMKRVHEVIKAIEPHDSRERYTGLGVDCLEGHAKIVSPWEVELNGKRLTTRSITIATGAAPFVPPIPGIDQVDILVSENLWNITELPKDMVILGGGPIGLEMAQAFSRLGSKVTIVEMHHRLMSKEDADVANVIENRLKEEGVTVLTSHKALRFSASNQLVVEHDSKELTITFEKILVAVGRKARVKGFGLEDLGVKLRANGTIETDEYLRTNFPNIFACGDVTGPYQLTHMASHQAWYCAVNGIFGFLKKFKVDYSVVPWATYTDPEVATVGHTEDSAKAAGQEYEVYKYQLDDLDRAIADGETDGFVKVLVLPGTDKVIGATIVGAEASVSILEFVQAMKQGFGLNKILGTIHPYPSLGEANKYLAGIWKNSTKPEKLLTYLERFHQWRRS
ncbi:MAG: dihydrolipoyl dehydrogenase [Bdellovibrionales bacterium CG11_big_fil_rev_8_21_14_0_20_38_13]|nr:MAG: dihydrolipoyl dehydrogenase [Bdellovibrionales bacterium CG11_big_fil_rev_8_21_14_0_20_38_13]